jgi:AcrR family transcriptional regulator
MSTYHHGDLKAAVLAAASEILAKQGLAALSLREVARRAGVSHNAPYRHFPNRDSLLAELAAEGFRRLRSAMAGKRGREMGEAYVRFALDNPALFRLMFSGQLPSESHPALRAAGTATYHSLVEAFRGQPGVPDADKTAAAAWSLVHGLAQLLLDGHFPGRGKDFVAEVIGAIRFAAVQRSA